MTYTHEISTKTAPPPANTIAPFADVQALETAQRIAKVWMTSSLVPAAYADKDKGLANCLVAMNMANRIGADPMMVMQNLHIIQGNPYWGSPFVIASIQGNPNFYDFGYETLADKEGRISYCKAVAYYSRSGQKVEGAPAITRDMVKQNGWDRPKPIYKYVNGKREKGGEKPSAWTTLGELMYRYRAATYFARTYCPEILMGFHTEFERQDFNPEDSRVVIEETPDPSVEELRKAMGQAEIPPEPEPEPEPEKPVKAKPKPKKAAPEEPPPREEAEPELFDGPGEDF